MPVMIDLAVRALVVLGIAWALSAALRRQPASLRAFVWTVAFAGVIALPALTRVVPSWHVEVWQEPVRFEAPPPRIAPEPLAALPAARPVESRATGETAGSIETREPLSISPLWMLAALSAILLARIAVSHLRIARLVRHADTAGEDWSTLVKAIRARRGIRRDVSVRLAAAVNVPAVVGVFRPVLLLPPDACDWDEDLRRAVVLHELAHVARWDALAQLVEQIACALYWFLPLAWHGARRAAALRERASDDEVIRAGMPAPAYAKRLLDLVTTTGAPGGRLATLAMARPSRMRERVMAILDPVARREGLTMRKMMAAVVMFLGAVAAIAAAAPMPSETVILQGPVFGLSQKNPGLPVATAASAPREATKTEPQVRKVRVDSGLCGPDAQHHQFMSGERNGRKTMTVKISGGGCEIDLRSEGRLTFNDDFTDVAAIEPGGFFRLDTTAGGVRRQMDIESRNGTLVRTFRVGGREAAWDAAARDWFAKFLVDLDRRSAIGVDVRLPHMLRSGGVRAVLDETALIPSDYARNAYYTRLMKAASLSPAEIARALQQAAELTTSDHYAHELIRAFAPRGLSDAAQRAGVTALIEGMDSDHYIAQSVNALVAAGRPSNAEMDFLVRILGRMKSDHYKTDVLKKVLTGATLTAEQHALLARSAGTIESDHYASEFLRQLIRTPGTTGGVRVSFLEAVRDIQSDHYRNETLSALLDQPDVSERELLIMVDLAAPMSDHYESETLRKVLRHRNASATVREAVMVAADRLSSHYREAVRRGP